MVGVAQAGRRFATKPALVGMAVLLFAGVLLFARLGHYALWDDEAMIALAGEGVMRTGDTSVVLDHNVVAYRAGLLVRDLHDRSTPPLSAYVAAASMSVLGASAFALRFPFALFGFATVVLGAWWMRREKVAPLAQLAAAILLLGNVSFFLYCRQCRYYAPTTFFSLAVACAYLSWRGERRLLVAMGFLSVALFAANYMAWAALYACLWVDYLAWRRHERALRAGDWFALALPQVFGCGLIAMIWNPLRTSFGNYLSLITPGDRVSLFFWNLRDMNACEFLVGGLLIAAGFAVIKYRDRPLLRALVALVVYEVVITASSPTIMSNSGVADVRYSAAVIPLCIAIGAMAIVALAGRKPALVIVLALAASGTNLLKGRQTAVEGLHSTILEYLGELANPPGDPYTLMASWINENVRNGESVWVLPAHMAYPLMFHAPKAVYAWQLDWPPQPQFRELPPIHFRRRALPDYVVAFGRMGLRQMARELDALNPPARYERIATIDFYGQDMHRPELFWRTFRPIANYDKNTEAIYVFRRLGDAPA